MSFIRNPLPSCLKPIPSAAWPGKYSPYQPCKAELEEGLPVNATFVELTAAVVKPVRIRCDKPQRKR